MLSIFTMAVLIIVAVVLVVGAIKMSAFLKYRSEMNARFPGPPGNLIFGNALELMRAGGFTEEFFDRLHDKYGDVVRFWLMGDLNISLRNPKHLAQVHASAPIRPRETKKIMAFLGEENLLFMEDSAQIRSLREQFIKVLNSRETRDRLVDLVEHRLDSMTRNWGGQEVNVYEEMSNFLYHINGTIFFGEAWMSDPRAERIYKSHVTVLEQFTRWSMVPFPAWHNPDYREFRRATKEWWKATSEFVDARRAALRNGAGEQEIDLLTIMLTSKDKQGRPAFTQDQVVAHVIGLLNGSFDTTRASLTWVLVRMAEHQESQDELRREILRHCQENPAVTTLELSKDIELVDAIINESMRMISTVPVIQRANYEEETVIDDYRIPKGVTINLAYQQSFQYPDPYEIAGESTENYCPARFMGKNNEAKACRAAHKPFGSGPRYCVGSIYAMVEIRAILIYLLQRFEIDLVDGKDDFKRETIAGALQPSGPVILRFSKLKQDLPELRAKAS